MKRILSSLFSLFCLCCLLPIGAVDYCATAAWGNAGAITGGGNATPILVSDYKALKKALTTQTNQPKVIIVTQDIEFHKKIMSGLSDLTLLALPGVRLFNNETEPDNSGLLHFEGRNIILRNLTLRGAGVFNDNGKDLLEIVGGYHIWVDHCDFCDGMDENVSVRYYADSLSFTWCRFHYSRTEGEDINHQRAILVGSNSSDIPADGSYDVTFAYCWWDEGCNQRMARTRHSVVHYLNCYWNSSISSYYLCVDDASCYAEGCTFEGEANRKNKVLTIPTDWETVNYWTFVNCEGNIPADEGVVSPPEYEYDHLMPAEAKAYVTDPTCGAGATLVVKKSGTVFSPCQPVEEQEEDLDTVLHGTKPSKILRNREILILRGKKVYTITGQEKADR